MIKTLDKYILKEFLLIFGSSMLVLVVFYEMVSFIDMAGYFFRFGATVDIIFRYLLYRIPMAFFHVTPICVLLASTLTMCGMARFSEVVAMKAAGISLLRMAAPMIFAAGVISVIAFMDSEYLFHLASKETTRIYYEEVKKEKRKNAFDLDRFWYMADDGAIWNIESGDKNTLTMKGVSFYRFDPQTNKISYRLRAVRGHFDGEYWVLEDCHEQKFERNGDFVERPLHQVKFTRENIPLKDFKAIQLEPEEMNLEEISGYIAHMRKKGYDATRYVAEYYGKIAFPFISFVMPFIAVPLGARSSRAGGFLFGIMVSVLVGVTFWFLFSMGLAFGRAGRMPPEFAAFAAHIAFLSIGLFMLTTKKQ